MTAPNPSPAADSWTTMDKLGYALAGLAWLVFSFPPVRALVAVYRSDPDMSHGFLAPLVAGLLVWRAREQLRPARSGPGWAGLLPLLGGCALVVLGHWFAVALQLAARSEVVLQGAGWLLATGGLIWLLAGPRRARILAANLAFLVFVIPFPDSLQLPLALFLQKGVAILSAGLLQLVGFEVFREGIVLNFPATVLVVAGDCSGIRSLLAFFATAAACAAFLKLKAGKTALLLLLAPVVAVATNILRVVVTSFLVRHGDNTWLEGVRHDWMGLAVVLLGGTILFAVAERWARPTYAAADVSPPAPVPASGDGSRRAAGVVAVLLLGATIGVMLVISRHYAQMPRAVEIQPAERRLLAALPRQIGLYRCTDDSQLLPNEQASLNPADYLVRSYEGPAGERLELTILYWAPQRVHPGTSAQLYYPHTPHACMPGIGWRHRPDLNEKTICDWLPDLPLYAEFFEKPGRRRLVLFWNTNRDPEKFWQTDVHQQYEHRFIPRSWRQRLATLVHSWTRLPESVLPSTFGVRIDIDFLDEMETARARAHAFAREIAPLLPAFGIGPGRSHGESVAPDGTDE